MKEEKTQRKELKEKPSLHVQQENFETQSGVCHHIVHNDITRDRLKNSIYLLKQNITAGNELVIETSPTYEVVEAICNEFSYYPGQVHFKFKFVSNSNSYSRKFGRTRITTEEQTQSIIYAYSLGFRISISFDKMGNSSTTIMETKLQPYITD